MSVGDRIKKMQVPTNGSKGFNICMGVLNILIPGLGIAILGAKNDNKDDMIIGLLQFLCTLIIFGWIWAIVWGILIIVRNL